MSQRFNMSDDEADKVKRMSTFIAVYHSRAFLQSRLSTIAPSIDLKYLTDMKIYAKEDAEAAEMAIKSVLNHLWYLTEEVVVFAIFDKELPVTLREAMVKKLLSIPRPQQFLPQKPIFPRIDPSNDIDFSHQLLLCIGPRSWLLFDLLQLRDEKLDWMRTAVIYWDKMIGYQNALQLILSMEVVNDSAERGVKLVTDFKDVSKDANEQQYLFQVIEDYRNRFQTCTKTVLNK